MTRLILTAVALTTLAGCASTGGRLPPPAMSSMSRPPVYAPSVVRDHPLGQVGDHCGQFKFSDPACSPMHGGFGG